MNFCFSRTAVILAFALASLHGAFGADDTFAQIHAMKIKAISEYDGGQPKTALDSAYPQATNRPDDLTSRDALREWSEFEWYIGNRYADYARSQYNQNHPDTAKSLADKSISVFENYVKWFETLDAEQVEMLGKDEKKRILQVTAFIGVVLSMEKAQEQAIKRYEAMLEDDEEFIGLDALESWCACLKELSEQKTNEWRSVHWKILESTAASVEANRGPWLPDAVKRFAKLRKCISRMLPSKLSTADPR